MVNGFKVRVKDARQKDRNHQVEVDFEVPLTYPLADNISPAMARDIFEVVNGDYRAKAEILEAAFDIQPDPQLVEVREHPDLDPLVRIAGVTLRKIQVYRGEGGAVLLGFTATWTIGDYEREAAAMIRRLKSGVYLSCQSQQPELADVAEQADLGMPEADKPEGHRYPKRTRGGTKGKRRKPALDVTDELPGPDDDGAGGDEPVEPLHDDTGAIN